MTDRPSPADLAEAELVVHDAIKDGEVPTIDASLPIVMANYSRLQAVERAVADLVARWEAVRNPADELIWTVTEQKTDRLRALLTAAGPHQTEPENSNGEKD